MKRGLKMSRFLIIPKIDELDKSIALSEEYGFGFEFNDFFSPDVLDDKRRMDEIISRYKAHELPDYCTSHGDFFDVLVFSDDRRIRETAELRIRQSLEAARMIGAKGVVFHTNYSPQLTANIYVMNWIERNEQFWRRILPEYSDLDIYMENMFDFSPVLLSEIAMLLADMDNFGVCMDYAHAAVFGNDLDTWVNLLSPYVKHMHINDNDLENDLHLAVGDGKIDWKLFKYHFEAKLSHAKSVLIETSFIDRQRRSAEFLADLGMISKS